MFSRIVVPLDGSKPAEQVFPYVGKLAEGFGSEVFLISICEPGEESLVPSCELYIHEEAQKIASLVGPGSRVSAHTFFGSPAEKIVSFAREKAVDLIAMASYGRRGAFSGVLGTTANKLLHMIRVPLLLVKGGEVSANLKPLSRILVPLDGSDTSSITLDYVLALARVFEIEVYLLQVIEKTHHVHTIGGIDYVPFTESDIARRKEKAAAYLEEVARRFSETRARVIFETRVGDVAREILGTAGDKSCDLIALASHLHSGLEAWFYGSVSYRVLNTSSQSVLFLPSRRGE
jgi:nucleotide-binding universal stress UspA family protein